MADSPPNTAPTARQPGESSPATRVSPVTASPTSRRLMTSSDMTQASSVDQSLAQVAMDSLQLEERLGQEEALETPELLLKRIQQAAVGTKSMFREIGTGSIGKVFEHPGTVFVYKVPVAGQPDKLWNNYEKHMRVYQSFKTVPYVSDQVEIPRCFWYANPDTESFWNEHLERFPDLPHFSRVPRHIICMERIFPLPRPIRHALDMKDHEANKDCLIRPCLGRLKYGSGSRFFTLRNFKLHANEIKELDLPASEICSSMAHALAVLHWHTKIDAMDVEFILGSSPLEGQKVRVDINTADLRTMTPHTSTYEKANHNDPNFNKRITALWLIDFDDCADITMDSAGVDKAVKAFMDTNFYCPKPNIGAKRYIQHSDHLLGQVLNTPDLQGLLREFINKVSSETGARRRGSEDSSYRRGGFGSMRRGGRGSSLSSGPSVRESENTGLRPTHTPPRGETWRGGRGGSGRRERSWRSTSGTDST
ncbi:hypothetical protein F5144DRAFT_621293 [Chaetomium tenue]|uniref:Uncharacterized protein n=1 Tax=Chaetomium tenue TaxID=1854479 RepID=A0ACB7PEB6_9PEZI|nr:hypothetical protein F5144DRAFT_621293 [Chaetomium globosum]